MISLPVNPAIQTSPLRGPWVKFLQAGEHRARLAERLEETLDPDRHPVQIEGRSEWQDGERAGVLFRFSNVPTLGPFVGACVGDIVNNLRVSLDHLVWVLVRGGSDPRPRKPRAVQFPMAHSRANFDSGLARRLPGVDAQHVALIRRYQPYLSGRRASGIRMLQRLSNTDKHEVILTTVMAPLSLNLRIVPEGGARVVSSLPLMKVKRPVRDGTQIVRVVVSHGTAENIRVAAQGSVRLEPSLGRGVVLAEALDHMTGVVLEILDSFERRLRGPRYEAIIPGLTIVRLRTGQKVPSPVH
ncbi:MAG: hypothetical protein HY658_12470 [Actinobacteria bacterium]|nr:hypothetical protein [Actinomycetota bacterium]